MNGLSRFSGRAKVSGVGKGRLNLNEQILAWVPDSGEELKLPVEKIGRFQVNTPAKSKGRAYLQLGWTTNAGERKLVLEFLSDNNRNPAEQQEVFLTLLRKIRNAPSAPTSPIASRSSMPANSATREQGKSDATTTHSHKLPGAGNNVAAPKTSGNSRQRSASGPKARNAYLQVQVSNPSVEGQSSDVHVVYTVDTSTNIPNYPTTATVLRRYSHFEELQTSLMQNHPRAAVPSLPGKSLLNRFNSNFTTQRCAHLDTFLKKVTSNPLLRVSPHLQRFLTLQGAYSSKSNSYYYNLMGKFNMIDSPALTQVESLVSNAFAATEDMPTFTSAVEEEFWQIKQIMKRWGATPRKLPFNKFVTLVLGTTSAGKSSFINHFFQVPCKKSASCQQDTAFTIVETVPRQVFAKYSDKYDYGAEMEVQAPNFDLTVPVNDPQADKRYGFVYVYLDTHQTLMRYDGQLQHHANTISNFHLFQTVLINEDYLPENKQRDTATQTILIDSPGFDSGQNIDVMDKFASNLEILQFLYTMCDMSMFFIPATQLNMVSNQIHILELSVLWGVFGKEKMLDLLNRNGPQRGGRVDKSFISSLKDFKSFVVQGINVLTSSTTEQDDPVYHGTSLWQKTLFILSQIDLIKSNANHATEREQFFELGRLFGTTLSSIPCPTVDQCFTMGLPEHQKNKAQKYLGDLELIKKKIRAANETTPHVHRLEASIQGMCLDLETKIEKSWSKYSPTQFVNNDIALVRKILQNSKSRVKAMV